jgi:hypothetical protein
VISTLNSGRAARALGATCGLVAAAALIMSWRTGPAGATLGAQVRIAVSPTGELALKPAGTVLTGYRLRPGRAAASELRLTNQTPKALAVRLRAVPSSGSLDETLVVSVSTPGRTLAAARLGHLHEWTPRSLTIAAGHSSKLELRASVLAGTRGGYEGQRVDVELQLDAKPLGA